MWFFLSSHFISLAVLDNSMPSNVLTPPYIFSRKDFCLDPQNHTSETFLTHRSDSNWIISFPYLLPTLICSNLWFWNLYSHVAKFLGSIFPPVPFAKTWWVTFLSTAQMDFQNFLLLPWVLCSNHLSTVIISEDLLPIFINITDAVDSVPLSKKTLLYFQH